jgi:hypothetical protein
MRETQPSKSSLTPEQLHRREVFWQVILPASLGAAVFIALCVWAVVYTIGYVPNPALPDQQTSPAKVAVIWILLPTCLGGIFQLVLLGGVVFLLTRGIRGLPELSHQILSGIEKLSLMIHNLADRLAAPVISVASSKAGVDRFIDRIAFWRHSAQGD